MIINFGVLGNGGGGGGYVLPVATASRLGGVKVGSGLTITQQGVLSADGAGDIQLLKSVSELPASAETGDVVGYQGDEEYPNGITFNFNDGINGGTFTIPVGSLDDYSIDEPLVLGTVQASYSGGTEGSLLTMYAYRSDDSDPVYIFSPSTDGNLYDPDLNFYMSESDTSDSGSLEGVMFTYNLDGNNNNMVIDIYPDTDNDAVSVSFDDVLTVVNPMGVYQYDGEQWQRVGNGGGGSGEYLLPASEPVNPVPGEVYAYAEEVTGHTPHNYTIDVGDGANFTFVVEKLDRDIYTDENNAMFLGTINSPNAYGGTGAPNEVSLYLYCTNGMPPTFRYVDSNGDNDASYIESLVEMSVELDGPYDDVNDNQIFYTVHLYVSINDEGFIEVNVSAESNDPDNFPPDLTVIDGIDEGGEEYTFNSTQILQYDGNNWNAKLTTYFVDNEEDRDLLISPVANEGDTCRVDEHIGTMPEEFNTYASYGWGFSSIMGNMVNNGLIGNWVHVTVEANPYYNNSGDNYPDGYFDWETNVGEEYGFSASSVGGYYFKTGGNYRSVSVGSSIDVNVQEFNNYSESNSDYLLEYPGNQGYRYVLKVEPIIPQTTYQYMDGKWFVPASKDEVKELSSSIGNVESQLSNKFGYFALGFSQESDVLPNLYYYPSGAYQVRIYANPSYSKGLLLHEVNTSGETENKYVRELVTSEDVGKIVALTQSEYDALEQAGELVSTTFYAIIPEPEV